MACGPTARLRSSPSSSPPLSGPWGKVTPGNSLADHRRRLLGDPRLRSMRSRSTASSRMAAIVDCEWAALDPLDHGLGSGAVLDCRSLKRRRLALDDIGLWEINEAFAAQVLACLARLSGRHVLPRGSRPRRPCRRRSRATSSMSMAAPSGSAIRSAPAATASCCISSTRMRRLGVKQRHRHRVHRRRPGRRHPDRDGVTHGKSGHVLEPRELELGPLSRRSGQQRRGDIGGWRATTTASPGSCSTSRAPAPTRCRRMFSSSSTSSCWTRAGAAERRWCCAPRNHRASSPAPTSANSPACPMPRWSRCG